MGLRYSCCLPAVAVELRLIDSTAYIVPPASKKVIDNYKIPEKRTFDLSCVAHR